jgi:hypothetical protein
MKHFMIMLITLAALLTPSTLYADTIKDYCAASISDSSSVVDEDTVVGKYVDMFTDSETGAFTAVIEFKDDYRIQLKAKDSKEIERILGKPTGAMVSAEYEMIWYIPKDANYCTSDFYLTKVDLKNVGEQTASYEAFCEFRDLTRGVIIGRYQGWQAATADDEEGPSSDSIAVKLADGNVIYIEADKDDAHRIFAGKKGVLMEIAFDIQKKIDESIGECVVYSALRSGEPVKKKK